MLYLTNLYLHPYLVAESKVVDPVIPGKMSWCRCEYVC